jgi:hypothetical protein
MVAAEDPVMQQLAGAVSGMAGGVAASANDEGAIKYLHALYVFAGHNGIAYQTPPGFLISGNNGQHIKFGRDVLRNRAGTCVDLAVLFASACEAVGLRPVLVVIPGHCFPACYLPSGQLVAVESTMIGKADFKQAFEYGMKELADARQSVSYLIDVQEHRALGVYCIDLPEPPLNYLDELGYKTVSTAGSAGRSVPNDGAAAGLAGKWTFDGTINGVQVQAIDVLAEDGSYAGWIRTTAANGYVEEATSQGTWAVENGKLVVRSEHGTFAREFKLENGKLYIYFREINTTVAFRRAE